MFKRLRRFVWNAFPPSFLIGFPPAVIDEGKGMSTESRRAWIEEKSLILKQTYW